MTKQLTVIEGQDKGRVFMLSDAEPLQIGRSGSTGTRLNDLRVSRNHCKVEVEGTRVVITDLNSTVGTFVNDQKINKHQLHSGDSIRIGDTELRYMDDEEMSEAKTIAGDNLAEMMTAGTILAPPTSKRGLAAGDKAPLSELVGKSLAHFDIQALGARGNTSVVFQARDTREDRAVALKVFLPDFSKSEGEMERLARTIQPLLALKHANLVSLYGAGKSTSYCWIAMEYVEGENLAQMIQRVGMAGMLDWQHALRIALHLCRGLEYVHEQQFTHRAIMPKNILMASSDKLAKLGALIHAQSLEGSTAKPSGRPAELLRDVAYLPPERVRDESYGDRRSDIYSLGATLYTLITGRPPFEGKSPVETIAKVLQNEPAGMKESQLSLPDLFEQVVMRTLAKKPEQRYQTATELLTDLERIVKNPSAVGNGRAAGAADAEGCISVVCKCGQKLQAREKYAGTRVRCPRCGRFMVLPGQPDSGESSSTSLPPRPEPSEGESADEPAVTPRHAGRITSPQPPDGQDQQASARPYLIAAAVAGLLFVLIALAVLAFFLTKGPNP